MKASECHVSPLTAASARSCARFAQPSGRPMSCRIAESRFDTTLNVPVFASAFDAALDASSFFRWNSCDARQPHPGEK